VVVTKCFRIEIPKTLHNPNQISNKQNEIKNVMNLKFKIDFQRIFRSYFLKFQKSERVGKFRNSEKNQKLYLVLRGNP
jgi:hypothetical protein